MDISKETLALSIGSASSFGITKYNRNTPTHSKTSKNTSDCDIRDKDSVYKNGEIIVQDTKTKKCDDGVVSCFHPREKSISKKSFVVYRCKKCRLVLASGDNVISHQTSDKGKSESVFIS